MNWRGRRHLMNEAIEIYKDMYSGNLKDVALDKLFVERLVNLKVK